MQIENLRDVLRWTKDFHFQLSKCLDHCSDQNLSERAALLLGLGKYATQPLSDALSFGSKVIAIGVELP